MHEMAIATSLLQMAQEEAEKAGCSRLVSITIQYGALSGIMPEALEMAFAALASSEGNGDIKLCLERLPARMRCIFCNTVFTVEEVKDSLIACPECGEIFGHVVEQGKELVMLRIEADK